MPSHHVKICHLTVCGVVVHMAITKISFTDSTTYRQGSSCVEYEIG